MITTIKVFLVLGREEGYILCRDHIPFIPY